MRILHLLYAALAAGVLTLGATPAIADCKADLATVDKSFEETIKRLETAAKGTQTQKCAAYRSHVAVMTKGRDVFMRCTTGHTQRENVGQMSDSIGDFVELIKTKCSKY
jgi:hypothetical protein